MRTYTINLTEQELQIVATAIQRTDPTGMYAGGLLKNIDEQVKANPPAEVKEGEV